MHVPHRLSLRPALVRLAALTVITLAVPAARAAAQAATPSDSVSVGIVNVAADSVAAPAERPVEASSQSGAALTGLRSAVHSRETARAARPNAMATNASLGQARAMMIVGGAALITGAIIGGDPGTVIMVGGAIIGLYGLYQYLQ